MIPSPQDEAKIYEAFDQNSAIPVSRAEASISVCKTNTTFFLHKRYYFNTLSYNGGHQNDIDTLHRLVALRECLVAEIVANITSVPLYVLKLEPKFIKNLFRITILE